MRALAATVREAKDACAVLADWAEEEAGFDSVDVDEQRSIVLEALAVLEKQAADAQAELDTWVDRYDGARAEADGWHASSDATLERAVRAEGALRQACEALNDVTTAPTLTEAHLIAALARDDIHSGALTAAGADTP